MSKGQGANETTRSVQFREWVSTANLAMTEAITHCFNRRELRWQENIITVDVLEAMGRLGTDLRWKDKERRVKWRATKLRGAAEQQFGDIVLLVTVWLTEKIWLEGVAFYEAKRRYWNSNTLEGFNAVNADQLSRLKGSAPASSILFYDVVGWASAAPQGVAYSVPMPLAQPLAEAGHLTSANLRVQRFGQSWAAAFGANLLGFNLDFDPNVVGEMKKVIYQRSPVAVVSAVVTPPDLEMDLLIWEPPNQYEAWISEAVEYEANEEERSLPTQSDDDYRP